MNIEFEKSFNGTMLILSDDAVIKSCDTFEIKIVENNRVDGLISYVSEENDGIKKYVYNVTSMISLENYVLDNELDFSMIKKIVLACTELNKRIEEYMLSESHIVLYSKTIFLDPEKGSFYFIHCPIYNNDFYESIRELSEFIISNTNHGDEQAVKIAYEMYKMIHSGNFEFERLISKYNRLPEKIQEVRKENAYKEQMLDINEDEERAEGKYSVEHNNLAVILIVCIIAGMAGYVFLAGKAFMSNRVVSYSAIMISIIVTAFIVQAFENSVLHKKRRRRQMIEELIQKE